jgi:hypothetical protein
VRPCKHGHADGALHIPCPDCRIEWLEARVSGLERAIDQSVSYLATGRKNLAEDTLNIARLRMPIIDRQGGGRDV